MIPCAYPKAQYLAHKNEIDAAIRDVLESGTYILGEQVASFECEFAKYLGSNFAIGCGSATDALMLAMKAFGIGSGDEVIVPAFTAVPTVAAVAMTGATPVYVDIEPNYYTIDPDQVEAACTDKTKAIIMVHLYGQAADMNALMGIATRRNLRVIEDCAQAAGASFGGKKLGTIGDVGCFSFFPTKNLGAIGDGGAVVCQDKFIAEKIRRLRQYGWDEHRISHEAGVNSRLDEIQAAVLRVKLKYLDADNLSRRKMAQRYSDALSEISVKIPECRLAAEHVYHLYAIQSEHRADLVQHLKVSGIAAGIHYPVQAHQMPAYACNMSKEQVLSNAERLSGCVLSLPLYPEMSSSEIDSVVSSVNEFYKK